MNNDIKKFLSSSAFAVAGASVNREKFGNKVLRCYMKHNMTVFPLHPLEAEIEGLACFRSISTLPAAVKSISIITPPSLTEKLVDEAILHGIENIWMQPGAASAAAVEKCINSGINVIANGACILVELGCHD